MFSVGAWYLVLPGSPYLGHRQPWRKRLGAAMSPSLICGVSRFGLPGRAWIRYPLHGPRSQLQITCALARRAARYGWAALADAAGHVPDQLGFVCRARLGRSVPALNLDLSVPAAGWERRKTWGLQRGPRRRGALPALCLLMWWCRRVLVRARLTQRGCCGLYTEHCPLKRRSCFCSIPQVAMARVLVQSGCTTVSCCPVGYHVVLCGGWARLSAPSVSPEPIGLLKFDGE